jgi:hypothetical protein
MLPAIVPTSYLGLCRVHNESCLMKVRDAKVRKQRHGERGLAEDEGVLSRVLAVEQLDNKQTSKCAVQRT